MQQVPELCRHVARQTFSGRIYEPELHPARHASGPNGYGDDAESGRHVNPPGSFAMPLIFSYGTLQQDNVQLSTFGRLLQGHADELVGAEQSTLRIDDENVVATSGRTHHPVVRLNGLAGSRVRGTVFEITDAELARADQYEVAAYKRVAVVLVSGKEAWVYVDARPPSAAAEDGRGV
jgi:gamma-glutamylcyclotransferase (GGCT)/AIG2-like uncharacterized protein YtfP